MINPTKWQWSKIKQNRLKPELCAELRERPRSESQSADAKVRLGKDGARLLKPQLGRSLGSVSSQAGWAFPSERVWSPRGG